MKKAAIPVRAFDGFSFDAECGTLNLSLHDSFGRLADIINRFFDDDYDMPDVLGPGVITYRDVDYDIGKREWKTLQHLLLNNYRVNANKLAELLGVKKDSAIRYGKMLSKAFSDLLLPFEVSSGEEIVLRKIST